MKVSVVIPAYNAEKFIKDAIDSVLKQTFRDFEIIVVDDGSRDATAEIAKSYGEPVRCIQKTNGGVSSARNTGIAAAAGEYLAFLDADDVWEAAKLEKQTTFLDAQPDIGLCFTGIERVDENLLPIARTEACFYPDYCEALLLYLCVVNGPSSAIVRQSVVRQIDGFDTSLTNYEDWDYWLRLSLITKFAPIPEQLVKYRVSNTSASYNLQAVERDMQRVLKKFFGLRDLPEKYKKLQNKSYSNNWMILSGDYLHAGKYADSLRCMLRALRFHPQNVTRPLGLPLRWTKKLLHNS